MGTKVEIRWNCLAVLAIFNMFLCQLAGWGMVRTLPGQVWWPTSVSAWKVETERSEAQN